MKVGSVCVAYKEERFIKKHLLHLPEWVEESVVLHSTIPWFGENVDKDDTPKLARPFATVVSNYWKSEEEQRNTGQELHEDKDWIIILDPDEFIDHEGWENLRKFLETTDADAVVVEGQYTMWKNGYVADPPKDYQMLIAVRPHVRFVDKRVVDTNYVVAPVWLYHFSWARTDEECWNKISHYAHAKDFNVLDWYENVWKKWTPDVLDVHPTTPDTLHQMIRVSLPKELDDLDLWPK